MTRKKLTDAQTRFIGRMESGEKVAEYHEDGSSHLYWTNGNGIPNSRTFRSLLNRGLIEPSGDGMFGCTQTYRLSDGPEQ